MKVEDRVTQGLVENVNREVQGSRFAVDASIGATTLELDSTALFDEDGGQARLIKQDESAEEVVTYTALDDVLGTLTLASGTTLAWVTGDEIQLYPKSVIKYAQVSTDTAPGDVLEARIEHSLRSHFIPGAREDDERESVEISYIDDEWVVTDILGVDEVETDNTVGGASPAPYVWSKKGAMVMGIQDHRPQMTFGGLLQNCTITTGDAAGDEPTGSDLIVDVLFDGVSAMGTDKLVVPAGQTESGLILPDEFIIEAGSIMEVEAESIGSTNAAKNVTINLSIIPGIDSIGGRVEVPGPPGTNGVDGEDGLDGDPGAPGADGLISEIQDEGVAVTDAPILDLVGAGVTVTSDGSKITATIPGGGGGGALDDLTDVDLTGVQDGHWLQRVSGVWVPKTPPGLMIARSSYQPVTDTNYTTSATNLVAVDAANFKTVFTAPPGVTLVEVMVQIPRATISSSAGTNFVGFLDTGVQVGAKAIAATGETIDQANVLLFFWASVTPGTTYTWELAYHVQGGGSATLRSGNNHGPIVITVKASV